MDVAWDYDGDGNPKDAESIQKYADRHEYITAVIQKEEEIGLSEGYRLSTALQDSRRQHLATTMRLFQRGKLAGIQRLLRNSPRQQYAELPDNSLRAILSNIH